MRRILMTGLATAAALVMAATAAAAPTPSPNYQVAGIEIGTPVCRTLEPAVDYFARDPLVALRTFDEHRDAAAWRALDVPGSPYAVALGLDGTVLAKGTFNSLGQLIPNVKPSVLTLILFGLVILLLMVRAQRQHALVRL